MGRTTLKNTDTLKQQIFCFRAFGYNVTDYASLEQSSVMDGGWWMVDGGWCKSSRKKFANKDVPHCYGRLKYH
jgi:hypothetical protein